MTFKLSHSDCNCIRVPPSPPGDVHVVLDTLANFINTESWFL